MTKTVLVKTLTNSLNLQLKSNSDRIVAVYSNTSEIEFYSLKGEKFIVKKILIENSLKRVSKLKIAA